MENPQDFFAFPQTITDGNGSTEISFGMTMRDYFAAKALPSILNNFFNRTTSYITYASACKLAYAISDQMLKQRELNQKTDEKL